MIFILFMILVVISFIDIIFLRIPNCLCTILFFHALAYVFWYNPGQYFLGAFLGLVIFTAGYFISLGNLGEGDIKLIPSMGLILGFPSILELILYSSFLSIVVFIINKKRKALVLPFAPFLSIVFLILFILQSSSF